MAPVPAGGQSMYDHQGTVRDESGDTMAVGEVVLRFATPQYCVWEFDDVHPSDVSCGDPIASHEGATQFKGSAIFNRHRAGFRFTTPNWFQVPSEFTASIKSQLLYEKEELYRFETGIHDDP